VRKKDTQKEDNMMVSDIIIRGYASRAWRAGKAKEFIEELVKAGELSRARRIARKEWVSKAEESTKDMTQGQGCHSGRL